MGAFNQLNGAIFDAGAIEARISAIDGRSIYNQRDGGILDFDSLARRLTALDGKVAVGQGGIEFDVDSFMRRLAAIEAGGFNPSQIAFTSGAWLDPSDFSSMFQDSAGTTPVTAASQPVGKILDKSGLGNNFTQPTTTSRPIENVNGSIFSNTLDGVDDGYSTASFVAGTLTSNMDCFIALKRAAATKFVLAYTTPGSGVLFACADSAGGALLANAGAGSPTYLVNGVAVPGGTATTRVQLDAAMTASQWLILEVRNLDLSAWSIFAISGYVAGFNYNGDQGGMILCPAQSTANRNSIRTWLGAKVGVTL